MMYRVGRGMVAALLIIFTFFYPLLSPKPHRIDESHARLIHKGMTFSEVVAIFGAPPGNYDYTELSQDGVQTRLLALYGYRHSLAKVSEEFLTKIHAVDSNSPTYAELVQGEVKRIREAEAKFDDTFRTMENWTSKNGSFDVFFDKNGLVSLLRRPGAVQTDTLLLRLKKQLIQLRS